MLAYEEVLLLGREHDQLGAYTTRQLGLELAATLSVGADPRSPSRQFKGRADEPNEDALLIARSGSKAILAVADAHFGISSSHGLVKALAERLQLAWPGDLAELAAWLPGVGGSAPDRTDPSESCLLLALVDLADGVGAALSFGDATLAIIGPGADGRRLNRPSHQYVSPARPDTFALAHADLIRFELRRDQLLLLFTDGIDECHYREPRSSVRPRHLRALYDTKGPAPDSYARALTELALLGVDGNPGGQDNIALIVGRLRAAASDGLSPRV